MGATTFEPRTVELPDGRALVVREVAPDDVDGLAALYSSLDQQDTYRRFFSVFTPRREFFEEMTTVAERGGFGLVASVTGPDGSEELVAEAGYTLLDDGDGELEITVARRWRGWLGPYLLDALLTAAAARGIPNLQADIVVTNGPMLSMVRSRGFATLDRGDASVIRVLIGTTGRTPSWPGRHDRPRVLVEAQGGRWHGSQAAHDAGIQVVICPGPRSAQSRCPALEGEACPLAAGADAIVMSHADDERWAALEAAHAHVHQGVPVCVEARRAGPPPPGQTAEPTEVATLLERLARNAR